MMRYLPTSMEAGLALIRGLWGLAVPAPVADGTQGFGSLVQALDGSVWLALDATEQLVMHPAAALDGVAAVLSPWEADGRLEAGTLDGLAAWADSTRRKPDPQARTFQVWAQMPALFQSMAKTHAEMIAAGLLVQPELEGGGL